MPLPLFKILKLWPRCIKVLHSLVLFKSPTQPLLWWCNLPSSPLLCANQGWRYMNLYKKQGWRHHNSCKNQGTLAIANPILTAPSAPLPIVALTSPQYPPPPGLPPLPDTDQPNYLLGMPLSAPTIPVVALPTRQSTLNARPYTFSLLLAPLLLLYPRPTSQ